jgi:serine/threonine-protein kinase
MTKPSASACLTDDDLQQLAHDGLSPEQLAEVEQHVTGCERCRATLESASSDSQWTNEIQPALRTPGGPVPELEECEEIGVDSPRYDSVLRLLGPTDDPNMLGRIGTYEIVGVIGRGGMGVVFKAFDPTLNRFVAIKMLLPHLAESGAARKRFAREGQAAAAVVDDHVLPIYSVAEWQGVPYIVTQFLRGSTLQKRIQQSGPLELKEIIRIGLQTARGLAAAHAQGLVHRDVKPSNILLDGTVERAMLTDFGLARAVDDATITRTGIISGTPQFMSPEQANGDPIDHRSDLFSLGGVLYDMCTGRPPFRAETTFGVLRKIRETSPRSIRELNADVPLWLESIVAKLLAKNPAERFETASEVAVLLEQCLAHVQQPTSVDLPHGIADLIERQAKPAAPREAPTRAGQRIQRRAVWVALIAVAIIAFIGFQYLFEPAQSSFKADHDDSSIAGAEPGIASSADPPTDWNAVQSAFDALEIEIVPLEADIQRDIDHAEMEFSEPLNSDRGENQ